MKIQNTSTISSGPIKMLIYGQSGAGKTYSARTLPQAKTLIISAENGLLSVNNTSIDYIDLNTNDAGKILLPAQRIERLSEAYNYMLVNYNKYDTLFIDSLTEISQIVSDFCDSKFPDRKDALPKWGEYNKLMTSIIKKFRDINCNVIFTCLSKTEKDDNNRRYVGFAVQGAIADKLPQFFDEVFYVLTVNSEEGKAKRVFQTIGDSQILSKDRSGKLEMYEEIDLTKILNKIRGEK